MVNVGSNVRTSSRYVAMLVSRRDNVGVHCKVTVLLYSVKDPERNERCASIESETGDRD